MVGKAIFWMVLSLASGVIYYIAGIGGFKGAKLIRRLGCSLLALGLFLALYGLNLAYWWAYLLFLGLNWAALSTYHDYTGYDNWVLTGLFYGLAALPLIWCGVHWYLIIVRAIFLALSIWWLRSRTGKVFKEEFFSGLLYAGSIPILLLPI